MRVSLLFFSYVASLAFLLQSADAQPTTPAVDGSAKETSPIAAQVPFQKFLLIQQGTKCVALRITEHPENNTKRARYEWYAQNDGSMDFKKANVQQGKGEVWEKGAMPGDLINEFVKAGDFSFYWSAGDWIYLPRIVLDTRFSVAPTPWTRLQEIDAQNRMLPWTPKGHLVSWGPTQAGLQMGIAEGIPYDAFIGGIVSWELWVRNVSEKPVQVLYHGPAMLAVRPQVYPQVKDGQGNPIPIQEPVFNFPVVPITRQLQPGEAFELTSYKLYLGSPELAQAGGQNYLDAPPGKYSIALSYPLSRNVLNTQTESWEGTLTSGKLALKILPAPEK